MTLPSGDDPRRAEVLARTERTYAEYVASGHADRWRDPSSGMVRALDQRNDWLVEALRDARDGLVIDLGTGNGALAAALDAANARPRRLIGVDILPGRLERAREVAPWAEFVQASADALPVADGAASAVVAMTLLSSLTEAWFRDRVATEVDRVLQPGGRLVVYDIRYPSPRNRAVVPIPASELRRLFPRWAMTSRTMTLLPPLARSRAVGADIRYSLLAAIPMLRSHRGTVLVKPAP